MEMRNFSDYSLQELQDYYLKIDKQNNPGEAEYVWQLIQQKETESSQTELASLGKRLGAAILDGLITAFPVFIVVLGIVFSKVDFSNPEALRNMDTSSIIPWYTSFYVIILYAAVNGILLYKYGQTVGKKLLKIKIVTLDNKLPSLGKTLGIRYVLIMVIGQIPILGTIFSLVDVLFIFRNDRRCIHDLIAGTKVITA